MKKNSFTPFLMIILIGLSSNLVAQNINTIAGGGFGIAHNIPATEAQLSFPLSIAIDGDNNIYFPEFESHTVRKVSLITGIITTVAGNETAGYSGDGDIATNASLNQPQGVAVDKFGNIYIADKSNYAIRKVEASTGIISTFAGTGVDGNTGDGELAANAGLDRPTGVCVDTFGNVYIAHPAVDVVRKVDIATGIISTIAGTGDGGYFGDGGLAIDAELNNPYGVYADKQGNLFIADRVNCAIRKIDQSTGIITTVAGIGTPGYFGDNGPATDAELNYPGGFFVHDNGDIYIADRSNHSIRKVTASTGIISTIVGTGEPGFSGDNGPAIDAQIDAPQGVVIDAVGNIIISDSHNDRIRQIGDLIINVVENNEELTGFNIYPNPSSGIFQLENEASVNQYTLTVYDALGSELLSLTNENKIDLSLFPEGNYFLLIESEQKSSIKKLTLRR